MMNVTEIALIIAFGLILVGYLLVVKAGFRREFLWGLITLIPGLSLLFVLFYWREARMGFAISLLGLLVLAGAIYGGGDRVLERHLEQLGFAGVELDVPVRRPWDVPVSNEALIRQIEQEIGGPLEIITYNPNTRVEPLPPLDSFQMIEQTQVRRAYQNVALSQLNALIGQRIRLTLHDGARREGNLIAISSNSLYLQQVAYGGTVAYEYRLRDVRSAEHWAIVPAGNN